MGRVIICPKTGVRKGAWTQEEDRLLFNYITRYGHSNWREVPKCAGILRDGKSCRLRWMNYLKPSVKRGNFTREENEVIIQMHEKLGNRWSAMAFSLPGRTDNEIKNHWHSHLKKQSKEVIIVVEKNNQGETELLNGGDLMSNYCVSAQLESSPNSSGFYWPVCSPKVMDTPEHQVIKAECETSSGEDVQFDGDFWNEPFLLQDSNMLQDDALSFADRWYESSVSPLEEALHPCKQQELLPFHEFGGLKAIEEVWFAFDLKDN